MQRASAKGKVNTSFLMAMNCGVYGRIGWNVVAQGCDTRFLSGSLMPVRSPSSLNDLHSRKASSGCEEDGIVQCHNYGGSCGGIITGLHSSNFNRSLIHLVITYSHSSQYCSTRPTSSCASIAAVGTSSRTFSLRPSLSSISPVMATTSISFSVKPECTSRTSSPSIT